MGPNQKKLLIVADDWEALEVYETRLQEFFEIHAAPFGSIGLQAALEFKPDVILVDLVFEDMHGEELYAQLRSHEHTQKIPITLILNQEEVNRAQSKSHVDPSFFRRLLRPFDFEDLIAELKKQANMA